MANIKKSQEMIDEVLRVMTGLRSAFASIVDLPEAREAAQKVAAGQRANGILPMRAQSGTTAAAPAAAVAAPAAPGAGARFRGFYAKNQQEIEKQALSEQSANARPAPAPEQADAEQAQADSAAAGPASFSPPPAAPRTEQTEETTSAKQDDAATAFAVPPTGGFGAGRMAGSALYRKMAQQ